MCTTGFSPGVRGMIGVPIRVVCTTGFPSVVVGTTGFPLFKFSTLNYFIDYLLVYYFKLLLQK